MSKRKIRYAVVGQGYISQIAVLPAFEHAKNSELVALVSSNPKKLKLLGKKYQVDQLYSYDQYEECLYRGNIDAVYIALPNHLHREYAEKAARAKVHVLCEKPMAVTSQDCEAMVQAAKENQIKLMIAYRLHFEEANLHAVEMIRSRKLGEPKVFDSVFTLPVRTHGIRLNPRALGGGPLYDIGIYCINAARYLFQDEPIEVLAHSVNSNRRPFQDIEETISVIMRFSKNRTASFTCSFDCAATGSYQVVGTKGDLILGNSYEYLGPKRLYVTLKGQTKIKEFKPRDQFAPELIHFSDCILKNRKAEPSGEEGLADIRIIESIFRSADERRPVSVETAPKDQRPGMVQKLELPPVQKPELVAVEKPSAEEAA